MKPMIEEILIYVIMCSLKNDLICPRSINFIYSFNKFIFCYYNCLIYFLGVYGVEEIF